ncbi:MAG: hypothetical protein Q8K70_07340 [Bacteroidota bacterium]|nr:hypothetical protein [Bacteroidota bacterium]
MKYTIILSFFLNLLSLNAQNLIYTWSAVDDFNKDEEISEVLSMDNNHTFIYKKTGNNPNAYHMIEKYDNNLKLIYSAEGVMEVKSPKDHVGFLKYKVCNGKALAFFFHYINESRTYRIIAKTIDDKGKFSEEIEIGKTVIEKFYRSPTYRFAVSPDGSKIGIIGVFPFEKETNEKWHVMVYEVNGLKKIIEKDMDSGIPNERNEHNALTITNSGCLQIFKKWDAKKEGEFATYVTIKTDGKLSRTDINFDKKAISWYKSFVNKAGHSTVVGFLNPDDKNWLRLSHYYYVSVDENGKIVKNIVDYLGEKVFSNVYTGSKGSKLDNDLNSDYIFTDFLENDKGELSLFIEKYTQSSKSTPNTDPTKMIEDFSKKHQASIVLHLDIDGKTKWVGYFDKTQEYRTQRRYKFWGGMLPIYNNDNLFLIWNNINFPDVPVKTVGLSRPGWRDASGNVHTLEEYGSRMVHPTCLSGFDGNGSLMFQDQPVKNAIPLIEMYKDAIFNVTFNSKIFGRFGNQLLLIMEMPAGPEQGASKYQLCKITVN